MRTISVFLLSCLLLLGFAFIMVKYPNVNDSFSLLKYNDDEYQIVRKYSGYRDQLIEISVESNFSLLLEIQLVTTTDNQSYVYHLNNYSISNPLNFTQLDTFEFERKQLSFDIQLPTMVILSIKYSKEQVYTAEALDEEINPIFPIYLTSVDVDVTSNEVNASNKILLIIIITLLLFTASLMHRDNERSSYDRSTRILRGDKPVKHSRSVLELIRMRTVKFEYRMQVLILPYIFSAFWIIQDSESIIASGGAVILLYYSGNLNYQIGLLFSLLLIDHFIGIMDRDNLKLMWSYPIDRRIYYITVFVLTTVISMAFINAYTIIYVILLQYGIYNLSVDFVLTAKIMLSNSITVVILQVIIYLVKLINTDKIQNYIIISVMFLLFMDISDLIFVNIRSERLLLKFIIAVLSAIILIISSWRVNHMEVRRY